MRIIIIIKSGTRGRNRDSSINFTLEVMKFTEEVGGHEVVPRESGRRSGRGSGQEKEIEGVVGGRTLIVKME